MLLTNYRPFILCLCSISLRDKSNEYSNVFVLSCQLLYCKIISFWSAKTSFQSAFTGSRQLFRQLHLTFFSNSRFLANCFTLIKQSKNQNIIQRYF